MAAIELREEIGPSLGRPAVDTITGSRHSNMNELRSFGGHLRALFAFDPRRQALILLGGNKAGNWTGWYDRNIPAADDLYDDALRERAGVSQSDLAERLHVSRPRVSAIERNGEDLRMSTIGRYVEALGGRIRLVATINGEDFDIAPHPNR